MLGMGALREDNVRYGGIVWELQEREMLGMAAPREDNVR